MAASNPPLLKINLLHRQDQPFKINFSALGWLATTGKYIIIVVELIVIGAFGARYYFDSKLATINEEINNNALPYLKQLQQTEREIRLTQLQLSTIKKLKADNPAYPNTMTKLTALIPQDITLTNLNFDRTTAAPKVLLSVTGDSPSTKEIGAFLQSLKNDSAFKEVVLTNLSSNSELGTTFTIVTVVQPGGS